MALHKPTNITEKELQIALESLLKYKSIKINQINFENDEAVDKAVQILLNNRPNHHKTIKSFMMSDILDNSPKTRNRHAVSKCRYKDKLREEALYFRLIKLENENKQLKELLDKQK